MLWFDFWHKGSLPVANSPLSWRISGANHAVNRCHHCGNGLLSLWTISVKDLENLERISNEYFISYDMRMQGCESLKCYDKWWEYALPYFVVYVGTQNKLSDRGNHSVCGSMGVLWNVNRCQPVRLFRLTFILSDACSTVICLSVLLHGTR